MGGEPIPWWEAEPARLERDKSELGREFENLSLNLDGQGGWSGELPLWPFDRPQPEGLGTLLGGQGLVVDVAYTAAYPMMFPYVYPRRPVPQLSEWTQARFHVLGNGALCLFQTVADWDPAGSIAHLLQKAAGWHVEYALLRSGLVEKMSLAGIVYDDSYDALVTQAVRSAQASDASPTEGSA